MRGGRTVGALTTTLLVAGLLAVGSAAEPAQACGCGSLLPLPETTVGSSNEQALIWWDGTTETIELTFDVTSSATAAGLLIPTPTPATMTEGDLRTFALAEAAVRPTVTVRDDWWGIDHFVPEPAPERTDSLDPVDLGALSPQTIRADDTVALETWLATGGFVLSDDLAGALAVYANYGWSFTALTLQAEDAIDGHIPPVRLSFETTHLVYPMRLARHEPAPQQVRLYVFDEHRNDVVQSGSPTLSIDGRTELVYAGRVDDPRLTAMGPYLTAYDIVYDVPKDQITSDVGFYESMRDTGFQPRRTEYRTISLLGVPVGTLVVAWLLVGGIIVLAHVRGRRRAR